MMTLKVDSEPIDYLLVNYVRIEIDILHTIKLLNLLRQSEPDKAGTLFDRSLWHSSTVIDRYITHVILRILLLR